MRLPDSWSGFASAARALPPETPMPVPAGLIVIVAAELVAGALPSPAEFSVPALAQRFGKAESTVRSWAEAGAFPGATKWRGAWRIPRVDVEAFEQRGREIPVFNGQPVAPRGRGKSADLGAWRKGGAAA